MSKELIVFLIMVACGGMLSVLFDLFRAARIAVRPGITAVAVSDILFWIIAGFAVIACVWNFNSGLFRFYEPLGLILGCVFYFFLFSRWIFRIFLFIIKNILKFVKIILKILLTPWTFLYKILIVPVKNSAKNKIRKVQDAENE